MIGDHFLRDQGGADAFEEGFFLIRLDRANRIALPVRIWFGPPADPETGEEMDRSPRWQVQIAGALIDDMPIRLGGIRIEHVSDFWPGCRGEPIDEVEYGFRIKRQEWAAAYDPFDPFATPGGRVDPMTATLPFMEG